MASELKSETTPVGFADSGGVFGNQTAQCDPSNFTMHPGDQIGRKPAVFEPTGLPFYKQKKFRYEGGFEGSPVLPGNDGGLFSTIQNMFQPQERHLSTGNSTDPISVDRDPKILQETVYMAHGDGRQTAKDQPQRAERTALCREK